MTDSDDRGTEDPVTSALVDGSTYDQIRVQRISTFKWPVRRKLFRLGGLSSAMSALILSLALLPSGVVEFLPTDPYTALTRTVLVAAIGVAVMAISGVLLAIAEAARKRLELLGSAGVLEGVRFVAWPERVGSSTDAGAAVRSLYESFRDAAGAAALDPAFERSDGALRVPALVAAARRDGRLVGLYPLAGATVEDATARLRAGDGVGNL